MSTLQDQIRERAYSLYVARGRTSGHELADWIEAEQEVTAKSRMVSPIQPSQVPQPANRNEKNANKPQKSRTRQMAMAGSNY